MEVERVLERMLPELEDLQTRGVFAPEEIKAIVKKRRDFEYLLRKRTTAAEDYLRYIEAELNIEALRRRRKARLGLRKATISDHAGIRLIHFIFDRALRKFRGSTAWWLQWLDFAMRTNSSRTVDRIFGRALMLHPRCEELWLQATEWHFDRMQNLAAARALLQRALRINKTSTRLWLAYFRLECLYVLKMKGRRVLLGLEVPTSGLLSAAAVAAATAVAEAEAEDGGAGAAAAAAPADAEDDAFLDALEGDETEGGGSGEGEEAAAGATAAALGLAGPDSFDAFAASAEGVPSDAAARALFFQGSVPRIVFDGALHAYATAPADAKAGIDEVSLRLTFLEAADAFRDPLSEALEAGGESTNAAANALGAAPPAFPELSAYIVSTLVRDFPDDARTWEALAGRPIAEAVRAAAGRARELEATVARRRRAAAALGRPTKKAKKGADGAPVPTDVSELADEDLFVVDGGADEDATQPQVDEEGKEEVEEAPAATAPAEPAAPVETPGPLHAIPGSALPSELAAGCVSAARGPGALAQYAEAALASGAADAHVLGGFEAVEEALTAAATLPMAAAKPAPLPQRLPQERCALWTRVRVPAPAAAAPAEASPSAGQKRKRGGAAAAPAPVSAPAHTLALALTSGVPGTEAALADDALLSWLKGSTKLALETLEAAQAAAPGVSTAVTAARTLARLAGLALAHGVAQTSWKLRMLGSLAAVCTDAVVAAAAAAAASTTAGGSTSSSSSGSAAAKAAVGDVTVGLAAALLPSAKKPAEEQRLAARAAAAAAAAPLVALARLAVQAHFRLGHLDAALAVVQALVSALPSCAAAHLLRGRVETYLAAMPADAFPEPQLAVEPSLATLKTNPPSQSQLCPRISPAAALSHLVEACKAVPKNDPNAGRLWQAAVEASAAAAAASGDSAPATALVTRACLAGLPAPEEAGVRQAALIAAYTGLLGGSGRRALWGPVIGAALGPSAPAPAYELATAAELAALQAATAPGAAPLSPAAVAAALGDMRRVFEAGVLAHGASSAGLWLTYMAAERLGLKLGRAGRDAASDVYARAVRALKGPALAAFVSGAKTLRN